MGLRKRGGQCSFLLSQALLLAFVFPQVLRLSCYLITIVSLFRFFVLKLHEMGSMLAQVGQAPCTCGASTLPQVGTCVTKTVPKVFIERNVSKGMQSANITDSFLLMRNQKSILIDSQIYLFRVVVVVSPAFSRDTNQKMKHGLHRDSRISFSRIFFDIIELMILGFCFLI